MQALLIVLAIIGGFASIITIVQVVAPVRHRLRNALRQWLFADELKQLQEQSTRLAANTETIERMLVVMGKESERVAELEAVVDRLATKADLHDIRLDGLGHAVDAVTPGYMKIGVE